MTFGQTPRFPGGFLWGAANAGHQVEGGNSNSDLWLLENVAGTAERTIHRTGPVDSVHHVK